MHVRCLKRIQIHRLLTRSSKLWPFKTARKARCGISSLYDQGEGRFSLEVKQLALDEMRECGALDKTKKLIESLRVEKDSQVGMVQRLFGQENWVLRLMMHKLR